MEEKILSMYAKGMTTGDIESHMREMYDIDISDSTISRITDKILPIVKEWQERPLEEVYAVVFMDAIHYHVRSEGRIVKRAVYIAGKPRRRTGTGQRGRFLLGTIPAKRPYPKRKQARQLWGDGRYRPLRPML